MKKYLIVILSWFFVHTTLLGDEGMWLLPLLDTHNIDTMKKMGLNLSADDIYNINHSCLKDAVVALDYGSCTAELISSDGLIITNHHCGFSEVQEHSSVSHDYLKHGFWAKTKKEELPNPGKTASFLIRMEDVSDRIIPVIDTIISESKREILLDSIISIIEEEAIDSSHYEAEVQSFFYGNSYFLMVYEVFKDIRLVGAPPSAIGRYGADTDNWVWPRHTGDFCLFRIYCGPDGKPAEYSEENIPYKPKHFFPISLKGYDNNDFTMVLGFPGRTNRYITSYEIMEMLEITHPNRIKIRGLKQELMMKDMLSDNKVWIQYADKYQISSNYYKYSIGQSRGLKRLAIAEKKRQFEKEFQKWVEQDSTRKNKYGNTLASIETAVTNQKAYKHAAQYIEEVFFSGMELPYFSLHAFGIYKNILNNPWDVEDREEEIEEFREVMKTHFKDYNQATDKKISAALLQLFAENVPLENQPFVLKLIQKKYKGNYDKFLDKMYKKSIFADSLKLEKFLANPSLSVIDKDPAFTTILSAYQKYFELHAIMEEDQQNLQIGNRLYIDGIMRMQEDKIFYPDANSTMRLTYGTIGDYFPCDAVHYNYYTTLKGVFEKENPDSWEFEVPEKLRDLYTAKDYGRYGEDDYLPVCFISNNDITGGNSGSPVLNKNGELIGLAFDGNWEAMSGDIVFENDIQKCINVDIRYVLFVIDKYAGATNLLDEMQIIE